MKLTILIPAYNEESNILNLLNDIRNSEINYEYEVFILENGSIDKTFNKVYKYINQLKLGNFHLLKLRTKGKTKALNSGIKKSSGDIIIQIDADCRLNKITITTLVKEFEDKTLKLVGSLDVPNYNFLSKDTLLYKTLRSQELYRLARGRVMPVGRCLAYRKDLNIVYPNDIHSEDNWIALTVAKNFGWQSIKVIIPSIVTYKPPSNWIDFIKQETRFDQGYIQLMTKYPELESVYKSRRKYKIQESSIISKVLKQLQVENIEKEIFFYFKDILSKIIIENSESAALEFKGSSWDSIKSTK